MKYDKSPELYNNNDIVFESRSDAKDTLQRMIKLLHNFKHVSLADFLELVGVTITSDYLDSNTYGWDDLRNACIEKIDGGYAILFPEIKRL